MTKYSKEELHKKLLEIEKKLAFIHIDGITVKILEEMRREDLALGKTHNLYFIDEILADMKRLKEECRELINKF